MSTLSEELAFLYWDAIITRKLLDTALSEHRCEAANRYRKNLQAIEQRVRTDRTLRQALKDAGSAP